MDVPHTDPDDIYPLMMHFEDDTFIMTISRSMLVQAKEGLHHEYHSAMMAVLLAHAHAFIATRCDRYEAQTQLPVNSVMVAITVDVQA